MFIVKITYLVELNEIDKYIQAHRDFLDTYYQSGEFLASGPMRPRTGGIVVSLGNDKSKIEAIFQNDPYYKAEVASYEFIEFSAVKHSAVLTPMLREANHANL